MNNSDYYRSKAGKLLAQEAHLQEKAKELYALADEAKSKGKIILAVRNKQKAESLEESARTTRIGAERALAKAEASQDAILGGENA